MTEYATPEALVETAWLAERLGDASICVIEVDEDTDAYVKGHIPGARALHWQDDLQDSLRREFLDQQRLAELLAGMGVGSDTRVVLYGGNNNWFAAYAYWLFKHLGFDNVALLNGGRIKWEREERPLTTETPSCQPAARAPTLRSVRENIRVYRDDVLASVKNKSVCFVDVRSPEEYRGERLTPHHLPNEGSQVPGHIPNAVNIPWNQAVNDDGSFKSAAELRNLYASRGVMEGKPVYAYCRIGERSAHTWLVLHELLGCENIRNYDGSWTEYGSLVGAPVER